eukprot:1259423-Amphidinium_carterae.1
MGPKTYAHSKLPESLPDPCDERPAQVERDQQSLVKKGDAEGLVHEDINLALDTYARQLCPSSLSWKRDIGRESESSLGFARTRFSGLLSERHASNPYEANHGEWTKCLELAEKQSPKMLRHYLIQHCKLLANDGEVKPACQAPILACVLKQGLMARAVSTHADFCP